MTYTYAICLQNKSCLQPSGCIVMYMHSAVSDLRCYQTMYLQNTGQEQEDVEQESLSTPSWLICSFPSFHTFRVSYLTVYPNPSSTMFSWQITLTLYLYLVTEAATKTITSPIHSKPQYQGSSATHVPVLALIRLEKSHPLHVGCLYLPWPSPVHQQSL